MASEEIVSEFVSLREAGTQLEHNTSSQPKPVAILVPIKTFVAALVDIKIITKT